MTDATCQTSPERISECLQFEASPSSFSENVIRRVPVFKHLHSTDKTRMRSKHIGKQRCVIQNPGLDKKCCVSHNIDF